MEASKPAPKPAKPLISGLGWIGIILWIGAAVILFILLSNFQLRAPLPGTRIPLGAGLNAAAQVVMIIALSFGWRFARIKDFRKHRRTQTTVVLVNWLMILFIMGVTFFGPEVTRNPGGTSDPVVLLEIAHGIAGTLAALSGGYLVFRMIFERALPDWIKVKNFKRMMQITIVSWLAIAVGGLVIFGMKYLLPSGAPAVSALPTPTAQPANTPEPTAVPATPTATPAEVAGLAAISDDRAFSDKLTVDLFNVPPLSADSAYEGWLIGNDGEFRLSVGVLEVGSDGHVTHAYSSPIGENLFGNYNEFIMTVEPAGDTDGQPSDDIRFSAVVPPGAGLALRVMLATVSDTPDNVGYLLGLRQQAQIVSDHVSLTDLALGPQDLVGIHRHAEHLVNAIEGLPGPNFGDLDGDGRVLNPGDGYGLLSAGGSMGYIESVIVHAQTAIDAPDATAEIKLHAGHVIISAQNAQTWAEQLNAKALELARVQDVAAARALLDEMRPLAENLLNGVDTNGDGQIAPISGEGTIATAYEHAQFAASPAYNSPLLEGGAPLVVAQATPTPTPPPATAIPTPAPSVVQVLMKDFVFGPQTLTVKVGTTVEFINQDNAPHTATVDDNSKDTGTLNLNDKFTLTFETVGEFPYFCLFHGGPGGVGMAGKIIVEP
ncbi:MAG TPA: DUF420 domain-containing protein [Anaerolineae bacterium]|nr:DUF420 domain-containing protein [Anaerolineae bacterium]